MKQMNGEDWEVIMNALYKYMQLYNIIQGSKKDFWRDKNAIDKLQIYINSVSEVCKDG